MGKDDTKLTGRLYEQGVELTRSLPGQGYGDSVKLKLNDADLTTLRNNLTQSEARADELGWYYPAWLTMMRESRAEPSLTVPPQVRKTGLMPPIPGSTMSLIRLPSR